MKEKIEPHFDRCGCPKPLSKSYFECQADCHVGNRQTPWCKGHDTDEIDPAGEFCDECWGKKRDEKPNEEDEDGE